MMKKVLTGLGLGLLTLAGTAAQLPQFRADNPENTGAELRTTRNGVELIETSGGRVGNGASGFVGVFPADSAAVKAINAALARPEGSPPAEFGLSLELTLLEQSSHLLFCQLGVTLGGSIPNRNPLAANLTLDDLKPGVPVTLNAANTPLLRFQIKPSGGRYRVDRMELNFGIRVENQATPERLLVRSAALEELPAQPEKLKSVAAFDQTMPSAALIAALNRAGFRCEPAGADNADAPLQFFGGRLDQPGTATRIRQAIQTGKTVVIGVTTPVPVHPELADLLPFNDWSIKDHRLRRDNVPVAGKQGWALDTTFDLHLPGSPMENSQLRYRYPDYEKPLYNSDWRILETTATGMPLLIAGRTGNAGVYVFGGSLHDRTAATLPGAAAFAERLVRSLTQPVKADSELSDRVEIRIPDYQPDGLYVELKNLESRPIRTVLSYQVANWEREILNAATQTVTLKSGETRKVALQERGAFKGDPAIVEVGSSLPYRRLRAGILKPDRLATASEVRQAVLVAPPVSIALRENAECWPKLEFDDSIDGGYSGDWGRRFVWPVGSAPELTIRVANRYCNVAPLAAVKDETTPDNPTTDALNDLSLSRAHVRQNGKNQGGWSGPKIPEHRLSLTWPHPVVAAGMGIEAYGTYRFEDRTQPRNLTLKSEQKTLLERKNAAYRSNGDEMYAAWEEQFTPEQVNRVELVMNNLDPRGSNHINNGPTNCSMKEWEVFGWPVADPVAVTGTVEVTRSDLLTGESKILKRETLTLPAYTLREIPLQLPAHDQFGPVRYEIRLVDGENVLAETQYDVFYVLPEHPRVISKKEFGDLEIGLLCTPGWVNHGDFGLGMQNWTQGWGGPHDKIWALTHGLMETGSRNLDQPARGLTTDTRNSHYTNPWRYLPDGTYGWDITMNNLLDQILNGRHRGVKKLWVVGSDRWNGIPIGNSFGWDMFVRFDRYLRKTTGKGLSARSRKGISEEIMTRYADVWQKWQLEEYAKKVQATQKMFADHGIDFMFETHGSFPLAGGELGDALGKTHAGVGTDLFWELRNQDLYWSLATRFAIVAANPNLRSGMYKQWGWINSESNQYWFANNGPVEPARRQWYGTYFMGRVDSEGRFQPYHVLGYGLQGGISTKFYPHEILNSARTFNFTRFIRPEEPTGYGFVVSWDSHLRRMTPRGGQMGFGLFATGNAENQLEYRMGKLYEKLIKNGLPIGFVSSSHALKKWNGRNPLVLLDASDWQGEELQTVSRLLKNGTPIVAFGGDDQSAAALKFWTEGARKGEVGGIPCYVRTRPGEAPLLYCPLNGSELPASGLPALVRAVMKLTGVEITTTPQLVVNPFRSQGALFLAFGSLSDQSVPATVRFEAGGFDPQLRGKALRVIDLDRFEELKPNADGSYTLPFAATAGRMLMITEKK